MARRSDHTRAEIRDLALAAAERIVAEQGIAALTARRVAAAIGYTPGTLYNVFTDLDELILELNGRTLDRLLAELAGAKRVGVPEDDLRSLLEIYVAFLESHPNLWNLLFDHRLPGGAAAPDWYGRKVDELFGMAESALAPLFEPGDAAELHQVTRMLWASVHGFCSLAVNGKLTLVGDRALVDMAYPIVRVYLKALRAK